MATEFATLGGGCFWCLEAIFQEVKGVESVVSGYSGGQAENPSYEMVSQGTTGHAEVVNITFDPAVISYRELLRLFFTLHDPTTPNRQGNDIGPQYRSVIYYHTPEQEKTAREVMSEMAGVWSSPIVTQLEAFTRFYPAEDFLQNFFRDNPEQGYCLFVVAPKVAQFRRMFTDYLKK
ncbi:MAG: peptide-methionine (S)-S-oxide reductase MsrA [Alistipes senegalensis]|nr:peptide-methionine (S)-S-oxide reductase MsrA [Oxalobacter formigenes]MCM1281726.1 peptide-methionine (S)-S-oxide reductase MsrA [Alistipes senegalensis]